MLSSTDVSAIFASQQAQFAQRNYFQVTTGAYDPTTMGIGAVGTQAGAGGFIRPPPVAMGVPPPPPVFSYGGGGFMGPGGGPGNSFAGHMMSGAGAAATLGGIGLGLASMTKAGGFLTPFVDPISMAIGGWRAGGLMGAAGAAALPLAIGAGASAAIGSVIHGGQQQQMMHQQLGQFSFLNPAARTGQGFTRQDASAIAGSIRELSHVPDMLTSVEELTRLLPKMRQMGVMQGVKDAAEFNKRFKETIHTIKDMSRILGSTMEEAAEFFQHSRMMGYSSRTAQLGNVLNAQFTSAMTGMTMGQTMGMQQGGAAMARQFGGRGTHGAAGVTNIAQRLQAGIESGAIEEGLLTDMTGVEGPEAVGAASRQIYGTMLGLSQSSPGQLIMAGALKKGENGRYEIDKEVIAKLNRGEIGVNDLKARASRLGEGAKMAFKGPQGRNLAGQFAGQIDFGRFLTGLVGDRGEEAPELVLSKLTGGAISEPEAATIMQMANQGPSQADAVNFGLGRSREMRLRERTDPGMIWGRIKKKMHNATFGALESAGGDIYDSLSKSYEDWIDDLVGRHIISLSKEGSKAVRTALSGGSSKEVDEMFAAASGLKDRKVDPGLTTGRFNKLGMMGMVGIGAGMVAATVLTGGAAALVGGAAALGAGVAGHAAGMDDEGGAFGDSETMAWWSSIGKDDTTGLSARGLRNRMENLTGYAGRASAVPGGKSQLDIMLEAGDKGKLTTREGAAAKEDILRLFGKLHMENDAMREGRADAGKRGELGRTAIRDAIENAMAGENTLNMAESGAYNGITQDSHKTIADWKSIAQKLEDSGQGEAARLVRAGVSGMEQHGIKDLATAAMMVSGQAQDDVFGISLSASTSEDTIRQYETAATADQARREALDKLRDSNLSKDTLAALQGSGSVRKAAAKIAGDEKNRSKIYEALMRGDVDKLRELGVDVAASDLPTLKSVVGDMQKHGAWNAVKDFDQSKRAEDLGAIRGKAKDAAMLLRASAQRETVKGADGKETSVLTAGGKLATEMAESFTALGAARTQEEWGAAKDSLRKKMSEAVEAYKAAGNDEKKKADILRSLGPYGEQVSKTVADLGGYAVGRDGGRTVSVKSLTDKGITEAQIKEAGAQIVNGQVTFDKKAWSAFEGNVAAGRIAGEAFKPGAAVTDEGGSDKQMLEALTKISKNSDLQASLLATLVNKQMKDGGKTVSDMVNRAKTSGGYTWNAGAEEK